MGEKSAFFTVCFPSVRGRLNIIVGGNCLILLWRQRFCDCVAGCFSRAHYRVYIAGRRGDSRIVRFVGFCFTDRGFPTASSPQTSFSFSEKEKEGKRKTAQGTAPRSEPRFAVANRDKLKNWGSMRLRPPRPPKERASRGR